MRALPLLALVLAASAQAQTADLAHLDRQMAALDDQLVGVESRLTVVRSDLRTLDADARALDADRLRHTVRLDAYQGDVYRYRGQADEVRRMYDGLARYGGTDADRRAYDDARYRLDQDGLRLADEGRALDALAVDLDRAGRDHALRVQRTAEVGRTLHARRADLHRQRETFAARRLRVAARHH